MSDPELTIPDWKHQLRSLFTASVLVQIVFWSWHVIWIAAVFIGIAPHLLPPLLVATYFGEIPWGITACALGLAAFPFVTFVAGLRLRTDHRRLFGLFYGVTGIGVALLVARLFFIREVTPEVAFVWITLAIGAAFFAADLFGRAYARATGGLPEQLASLVGYIALLVIGLWIGLVMGLYCIPAIVVVVRELPGVFVEVLREAFDHGWIWRLPLFASLAAIMACIGIVVLGMPFAIVVMYTRAWWRGLGAWRRSHGLASGLAITGAVVAAWIGGFVVLTEQPQHEAFGRLDDAPVDRAEQHDNLAHDDEIRAGLLNAYLAPYRYWGGTGNNVQLTRAYENAFGGDALGAQQLFNVLAAPLLYDGASLRADQQRAAIAYERYFDRPLQQGDRDAVMTALSATYDRSEAEAGLLDVGNRSVLLVAQELSTTRDGDIAHFELHETYENQTNEQQEVFYYFELPERAAITGLWLSAGAHARRDFAYTVAPRGAAQKVYREQRARRVDPALVEQVGPRQYRLRVFPIPSEGRGDLEPIMHLWMEWTVLSDGNGWKLPRLVEARNVYWDEDDTVRTIDGVAVEHDQWLPARIDAAAPRQAHELVIGDTLVRAVPTDVGTPTPQAFGRLAVVVDTSRSMGDHASSVHATLAELTGRGHAFDLFVAPSPWSADVPRRVALEDFDPSWYGGHSHEGVLADFARVRGDAEYAAVVVVSDKGSFAFQNDPVPASLAALDRDTPVWMLHLGGLPYAYRDELVDLVRASGGGAATDLGTVLARLHTPVIDGFAWTFEPAVTTAELATDDPFAPLAAAALIMHLGDRGTDLDAVHAIAKQASVVTPWSSMIVLVDERQRKALAKASEDADRFDREAETGVEQTTAPGAALEVNGTPEPHEWMLLAIAALGLLAMARSRRRGFMVAGA